MHHISDEIYEKWCFGTYQTDPECFLGAILAQDSPEHRFVMILLSIWGAIWEFENRFLEPSWPKIAPNIDFIRCRIDLECHFGVPKCDILHYYLTKSLIWLVVEECRAVHGDKSFRTNMFSFLLPECVPFPSNQSYFCVPNACLLGNKMRITLRIFA